MNRSAGSAFVVAIVRNKSIGHYSKNKANITSLGVTLKCCLHNDLVSCWAFAIELCIWTQKPYNIGGFTSSGTESAIY